LTRKLKKSRGKKCVLFNLGIKVEEIGGKNLKIKGYLGEK
jgi:hypothetical protein